MQDDLDMTDTRAIQFALFIELETELRKGEAIIAVFASQSWIAGVLTYFAASEECLKGQVNPYCYILQHLRVDCVEGGTFLFQYRVGSLLLKARQALAILLIGCLAFLKQVVVEPTALFKGFVELCFLLFCGVYAILKHFTHFHSICLNCSIVKRWDTPHPSALKVRTIHPRLRSAGLSELFAVNDRTNQQERESAELSGGYAISSTSLLPRCRKGIRSYTCIQPFTVDRKPEIGVIP
jgi:hypothetical protein